MRGQFQINTFSLWSAFGEKCCNVLHSGWVTDMVLFCSWEQKSRIESNHNTFLVTNVCNGQNFEKTWNLWKPQNLILVRNWLYVHETFRDWRVESAPNIDQNVLKFIWPTNRYTEGDDYCKVTSQTQANQRCAFYDCGSTPYRSATAQCSTVSQSTCAANSVMLVPIKTGA